MSKPTQYTTPVVSASAVGKRWRRVSPNGSTVGPALLDRIQHTPSGLAFVFKNDIVGTITEPGWTLIATDETQDTLGHPYPTPAEVRARQQAERERDLKALRERVCEALRAMTGRVETIEMPAGTTDATRLAVVAELRALGWFVYGYTDALNVELPEDATQEPSSEASPDSQAPGKSQDAALPEGWKRRENDRYGPRIAGPEGAYVERRGVGDIIVLAGRDDVLQAVRAYLALLPDDPA